VRSNWVQRVLFLVDRIALQEQALEAFKEHLPNAPIWPKQGERNFEANRRVYVVTYPTMLNIIEQDDCPLTPHFFDLIVADESHRSIYNIYKNIFDYFDAVQIGLTATPKDHIDHNTFNLFDCEDGLPTFAYTYEEAVNNIPPYLCDFEVLRIKTKFQKEGINSKTIAEQDKKQLLMEGKDPGEYNFEGTDLEKKVSNRGTNALIVREFMEECIKDPNGVLPGKTIFFALSKKHAYRLCEVFNSLYPEYKGQLAEVIISDIKGVHGKGGILDRFKNNDMPRVAISVDMLDTGIDVREVVNLVFAKPVFSYTKFWQMIGRGTRVLDGGKKKPLCPEKDKFLIMDCWENFEYFKMNPKGKEEKPTKPLPVRLFEARMTKLEFALAKQETQIVEKTKNQLRADIRKLPANSVTVLEGKEYKDLFYKRFNNLFDEILEKAKTCNNVATLQNVKVEADVLKVRLLNEIEKKDEQIASENISERVKQGADAADTGTGLGLRFKKRRSISIRSINIASSWQIETIKDLDKYMDALKERILEELDADTIINIEF
jgi:type I restriction enzyme R subunit